MARNKTSSTNKYALISVSNKEGIAKIARVLHQLNYIIISTGGTARELTKNRVPVTKIEEITGNPESFGGRMKTISYQIGSGILYDRSNTKHTKEASQQNIIPIDIVICNLYPFEQTISNKNSSLKEAIEQIDIGGPMMIRAAAKNYKHVLVVIDPIDYSLLENLLLQSKVNEEIRKSFAAKAFAHTSLYDSQISQYLTEEKFPSEYTIAAGKLMNLRYGENPHQQAAVYLRPNTNSVLQHLSKKWGRDLSLTNLTDVHTGIEVVRLFKNPTVAIIKHNSPCGIANGVSIDQALIRAIKSDPESAFGGIIVLNRNMNIRCAQIIGSFKDGKKGNIDIIAVPSLDKAAYDFLQVIRKSMGIYEFGEIPPITNDPFHLKWIDGGFVLQTHDGNIDESFKNWKVVTKKKPSAKELQQMYFAWKCVSRIKSNTIVVVDKTTLMTRGIGSGQTSRIRSTRIALDQAGKHAQGGILASDSFFPFEDSVELAAKYGVAAIVQQGGSINDQRSIDTANKHGVKMVFTGRRAFWH